ncbi:unnamed protein product, partial [Ectocarpus sp. 8 AP-2014]
PPPPIYPYSRNPHKAGRNTGTTQRTDFTTVTARASLRVCLHKNPDSLRHRPQSVSVGPPATFIYSRRNSDQGKQCHRGRNRHLQEEQREVGEPTPA